MASRGALSQRAAPAAAPAAGADLADKEYIDAAYDAAGRLVVARTPLVPSPVRSGSVASALTSDASTGAGNLINLTVTGDATLNLSNPADHQVVTYHLVASGAARTITFGTSLLLPPGQPTSVVIPQNGVLLVRAEYVGNRPTPLWLVTRVQQTDVASPVPAGVIARHRRPSASGNSTGTTATAATSAQSVARLAAAVIAGRAYRVRVAGHYISTVAADAVGVQITYTTDGSTPTVSSTSLGGLFISLPKASTTESKPLDWLFTPTVSGTFTALLSFWRQAGSGTCTMQNSATLPLDVFIEDLGPDPVSSGAAL